MSKETKEEKFNNDMIAQAVNMVTKSDNHIYMLTDMHRKWLASLDFEAFQTYPNMKLWYMDDDAVLVAHRHLADEKKIREILMGYKEKKKLKDKPKQNESDAKEISYIAEKVEKSHNGIYAFDDTEYSKRINNDIVYKLHKTCNIYLKFFGNGKFMAWDYDIATKKDLEEMENRLEGIKACSVTGVCVMYEKKLCGGKDVKKCPNRVVDNAIPVPTLKTYGDVNIAYKLIACPYAAGGCATFDSKQCDGKDYMKCPNKLQAKIKARIDEIEAKKNDDLGLSFRGTFIDFDVWAIKLANGKYKIEYQFTKLDQKMRKYLDSRFSTFQNGRAWVIHAGDVCALRDCFDEGWILYLGLWKNDDFTRKTYSGYGKKPYEYIKENAVKLMDDFRAVVQKFHNHLEGIKEDNVYGIKTIKCGYSYICKKFDDKSCEGDQTKCKGYVSNGIGHTVAKQIAKKKEEWNPDNLPEQKKINVLAKISKLKELVQKQKEVQNLVNAKNEELKFGQVEIEMLKKELHEYINEIR